MNAITTRPAAGTSLAPATMAEAMKFAELLANSSMVPKDFIGKPGNVLVAVQWGAELGLGPMQALQGIAVINGRPTLWGDAALALVQGHHSYAGHAEGVEGEGDARTGYCTITRRGGEPQTRRFSVADAKKAGLWGKAGPWQQYPDRMLQLRARGFALRDTFSDALRGVITREEAQDIPEEPREVRSTVVHPQAAARPAVAAPEQSWPMFSFTGVEGNAASAVQWVRWCEKAIGQLEDGPAVAKWQSSMEPHFDALEVLDASAVRRVRQAASDRLDGFALGMDDFPGDRPVETVDA